jgi:hypothetical protein
VNLRLDRRLSPRRNTMIPAEIVFDGGRARVHCVIRNLSDGGARLELLGTAVSKIPATFDLIAPNHRPHPCRVAWRTLKEVGVAFREA